MGILPTANDNRPVFTRGSPATAQRSFSMEKDRSDTEEFGAWKATEKPRYGFGRQGEKAAGLRGWFKSFYLSMMVGNSWVIENFQALFFRSQKNLSRAMLHQRHEQLSSAITPPLRQARASHRHIERARRV